MVLGINGIRLLGLPSGVGRCLEAILQCLGKLDHPFDEIRVYTPQPLDSSLTLPAGARNVVLASPLPFGLWEQLILPWAHGTTDLLLCPSYVVPVFARCPTLLIHHGSYEGYPDAFAWWPRTKARLLYRLSAQRASMVCTVSHHSKRDIVRFYRIPAEKIHVIPDGVDTQLFRPIQDTKALENWRSRIFGQLGQVEQLGQAERAVPFFLYVGKPTKRRNLPNLIQAFGLLKRQQGIPHKLLLIGTDLGTDLGTGLLSSRYEQLLKQIIVDQHLENEVLGIRFANHAELALAYNACEALIYPSSYEGFGMPVLEAMACGTPVIALNNSAFPEFAGGIAHLLEDAHPETLKSALSQLLNNTTWREHAASAGPQRAADYAWPLITQRYIRVMKTLVEGPEKMSAASLPTKNLT